MSDTVKLALDRSVRRVDDDGHLHVERCVLSAAVVSPYWGREIPGADSLGLDADTLYYLYRDADALAAAASSMNGKPLIEVHQPVSADEHPREITVGSVNNCRFESPDLIGELAVWDGDAIKRIQDGSKRCVSAGYAYEAVPEAGEINGQPYTLKMVNIRFNHLALVDNPRVKTAIIGDRAPTLPPDKETNMAAHRSAQRSRSAARIHRALKDGVLAQDSGLDEIKRLLAQDEDDADAEDEEEDDKKKAEDDCDDMKKAQDEEAKKADDEDDDDASAEDEEEDDEKDKKAQDRAIRLASDRAAAEAVRKVEARYRDLNAARDTVRPLVGDVHGMDSAADVYRYALDAEGFDHKGVHPSALRSLVDAAIRQRQPRRPAIQAHDGVDDFNSHFGVIQAPRKL